MASCHERKCICGCAEEKHVFDGPDSICANTNCTCREFHLWEPVISDPFGNPYKVTNVSHFVHSHSDMFLYEDLVMKQCASDIEIGRRWCNATQGLLSVIEEKYGQWKGWMLVTKPKTFKR